MNRLQHAQDAAAYFDVLPLYGKEPPTDYNDPAYVRHGFKDATRDPAKIRGWFHGRDDLNVGIRIPARAIVLDPDTPEGKAFVVNVIFGGVLPDTPIAETGRDFLHIMLLLPDGEPMPTRMTRKEGGQLWDGVDLLVNGYLAAAGSIHPDTGKPYRWIKHPRDYPIMLAPPAIVERVRERMRQKRATPTPIRAEGEVLYEHEGRNTYMHSFGRSLWARGLAPEVIEAAMRAENIRVCRPALSESEMRKLVKSVTTAPDTAEFAERRARTQVIDLFPSTPDPIAGGSDEVPPTAPKSITLPDEAMIGVAREYADLMDNCTEAPREFLWAAFETYFAAVCAGAAVLDDGDDPSPRSFTGIIDESGAAKSHAMKKARRFYEKYAPALDLVVLENRGSSEGLQMACKSVKRRPLSVVAYYDEGRVFAQKIAVQNSTLLDVHTTLYEETRYGSGTKMNPDMDLPDVHLSLLFATVPDVFLEEFSSTAVRQGLINRLAIISAGPTTKSFPRVPNDPVAALKALGYKVTSLVQPLLEHLRCHGEPVRIGVHPDAETLYETWHEDIRVNHGGHGVDPNVRLRNLARRKALNNALMSGERTVSVDSMRAALAFVEYQRHLRPLLVPTEAEGNSAKMEAAIERHLLLHGPDGQWVNERDAQGHIKPSRYGGSILWVPTLKAMVDNERIERTAPGITPKRFRLHPSRLRKAA